MPIQSNFLSVFEIYCVKAFQVIRIQILDEFRSYLISKTWKYARSNNNIRVGELANWSLFLLFAFIL